MSDLIVPREKILINFFNMLSNFFDVQDSSLQADSIQGVRSAMANTQPVRVYPDSTVSTSKWPNSLRILMLQDGYGQPFLPYAERVISLYIRQ